MKINVFVLLSILLVSCSENSEKKFYESGNIKEDHFFNQNNTKDSSVYYFDNKKNGPRKTIVKIEKDEFHVSNYSANGQIISEGTINTDSLRVGKWFFYKKDTIKIFEYKIIRDKEYLNQTWVKNFNGDTIRGNYVRMKKIKDTVKVNELVSLRFYLEGFLFSKDSDLIFVLPEYGKKFDENFSNEFEIRKDTIKSLKFDSLNNHLTHLPLNHILISNFKFSSPGKKYIRGILKEHNNPNNDSVKIVERNIYFEKEMYVEDTIK